VKIVYLDQNKWVELARAAKFPAEHPEARVVLEVLVREAEAGRLAVPLTNSNIYETHKITKLERRVDLAYVQATLSQGLVFRGRRKRLETEITDVLRKTYGLEPLPRASDWFLSNVFFESTLEWDDPRNLKISERVVDAIRKEPPRFLFSYLVDTPDDRRAFAVAEFSKGSEKLREEIEARRKRHAGESLSMRRRIYSAMLVIGDIELICSIARSAGLPPVEEMAMLRDNARKLVNETPTYFIEREIALKLEGQNRPIDQNDFRDMQTFSAVLAYADIVIAENQFSNLAKQAGLHAKYQTNIATNLRQLPSLLESSA
jgi:hypothetical protein